MTMTNDQNTETSENTEATEEVTGQAAEEQATASNEEMLASLDAEIEGKVEAPVEKEASTESNKEVDEEVEEQKPTGRKTAKDRIKELTDANKAEKAATEAIRAELDDLKKVVREQFAKPEEEEEEEFIPVDKEAYDKTQEKIGKLEQKLEVDKFLNVVKEADVALSGGTPESRAQWEEAKNHVLASVAYEHMINGDASSEVEALKQAESTLATQMYEVHKKGKSVTEFMEKKALAVVGRAKKAVSEQKASTKGVDMLKLNELRDSAGAPTNKVAASNTESGSVLDSIDAEIAAERKAEQSSGAWQILDSLRLGKT